MSIFLDTAIIEEVEIASRWGWVQGVTTNPILLSMSKESPEETLCALAQTIRGPVFYQLTADRVDQMINEAYRAIELLGEQLVLKVPATKAGFEVTARLSSHIPVGVTAIYNASQALIAEASGARYAIIYYHRVLTMMEDGKRMVEELVEVLQGSETEPLAASIKSPHEAVAVRRSNIPHLTLPFAVLQAMTTDELSEKSVADFNSSGIGLKY